jgi:CubicO group peptidase (beta-lactamase class C family)
MAVASAIDRVLSEAVEAGRVPGVVAIATDGQQTLYAGAFGRRALPDGAPMTRDTVFRIASMTKAITSVAAMQLVEEGRLTLEEPLTSHLPELGELQVLDGFDPDGAPRFRPPRRAITLRHLLTHTAGFAYANWNADLLRLQQWRGSGWGPLGAPLVFDPGDRWEYSIAIDWTGHLVERLTGLTLEDYFRQRILDPLGMRDTTFVLRPDMRARQATVHQRGPDGSLTPRELEPLAPPAFFHGGGGLYSTGPDYERFLRMLLHRGALDGAQILRSETVDLIAQNHVGDLDAGFLRSNIPAVSNDANFFPGMPKRWGLAGLITTEHAPTGRRAGSWAWAGINNTYFWLDPDSGVAGLILMQILPFCDGPALDLFAAFERAVYD